MFPQELSIHIKLQLFHVPFLCYILQSIFTSRIVQMTLYVRKFYTQFKNYLFIFINYTSDNDIHFSGELFVSM